jgi:hypothetical protein
MSAWRIGESIEVTDVPADHGEQPNQLQSGAGRGERGGDGKAPLTAAVGTLVKWIPGEIIAFFAAATFALRETLQPADDGGQVLASQPTPYAVWLLIGAAALTVLVTTVAAVSKNLDVARGTGRATWWEVGVTALLALVAFVGWSLTVPGSYWSGEGINGSITLVVVAGFTLGFVPLAEFLTRWLPTRRRSSATRVADESAAPADLVGAMTS